MADPVSAFTIGSIIVGAGSAVYSGIQGAKNAEQEAALKREQADMVEAQGARESWLMGIEGKKLIGSQIEAYGQSGFTLSGSPLLNLEDTASRQAEQKSAFERNVAFRADQLRKGANISSDIASDRANAGYIRAGGTILTGAGQFYKNANPNSGKTVSIGTGDVTTGAGHA